MIRVIKLNSRKHVFHMPLPGHTQTVTVNLLYYIGSGKCITILKMHDAHKNKKDIVAYSTGTRLWSLV